MSEKVRIAPSKFGQGVFATAGIKKGECILEFSGAVIDSKAAEGDSFGRTLQVGDDAYMVVGPPSVYVNHSCNPNAGVANDKDLVALRDLEPGEEIVFDYSTTMDENDWTMTCGCNESRCRGTVGDFRLLPAALQQEYLGAGIVMRFITEKLRAAA